MLVFVLESRNQSRFFWKKRVGNFVVSCTKRGCYIISWSSWQIYLVSWNSWHLSWSSGLVLEILEAKIDQILNKSKPNSCFLNRADLVQKNQNGILVLVEIRIEKEEKEIWLKKKEKKMQERKKKGEQNRITRRKKKETNLNLETKFIWVCKTNPTCTQITKFWPENQPLNHPKTTH